MSETTNVVQALAAVMADVGAVGKDHKMDQGRGGQYRYRSIDDVLTAVHGALIAHRVVIVPEEILDKTHDLRVTDKTNNQGQAYQSVQMWCSLTVRWAIHGPAGDRITVESCGEALDSSDKATNKAHTAAQKVALCQALCIPYDTQDPDHSRPEQQSRSRAERNAPAAPKRDWTKVADWPDPLTVADAKYVLLAFADSQGEAEEWWHALENEQVGDDGEALSQVPAATLKAHLVAMGVAETELGVEPW